MEGRVGRAPRRGRAGVQQERDLALRLWEMGFAVIRAPASGAKAKRLLYPDLVAIRSGKIYAFEVKTRIKEEPIYIEKEQVEKLLEFIRRSGGKGYIAVKIIGSAGGWKLVPLEVLKKTRSGNYKLDDEALSKAVSLKYLHAEVLGTKGLDHYIEDQKAS
ncbi:MAG TPA: Holliday junction resolvase Hjc [Sulfolobales archaeon]|nr:Holliday junction resolvase Hjc [Sulfolobales archaeon]